MSDDSLLEPWRRLSNNIAPGTDLFFNLICAIPILGAGYMGVYGLMHSEDDSQMERDITRRSWHVFVVSHTFYALLLVL